MTNVNKITKGEAQAGKLIAEEEIRLVSTKGSVTGVYSIENPVLIDFNTEQNGAIDFLQGRIRWDFDFETLQLDIGASHALLTGQEILMLVQNDSGEELPQGTLVMGEVDNNGRLKTVAQGIIKVVKAITDGSVDGKLMIGIVSEPIENEGRGFVAVQGRVMNYNTSSFDAGTILFNDPDVVGGLSPTQPVAPNLKLPIAVVTKKAAQGQIYVRMTQGSKLGETDSNVQITNPQEGQVLMYDGTAGYWYNADLS
jgi:hypothetical protein